MGSLNDKASRSMFFTGCLADGDWQACANVIAKFAKSDKERRELRRRLILAKGAKALLKEGFANKIMVDVEKLILIYGTEVKKAADPDLNGGWYSVNDVLHELHQLAEAAEDLASAIKEECYERGRKED